MVRSPNPNWWRLMQRGIAMKALTALYNDLCAASLDPISIKEVLCAVSGVKAARLCLRNERTKTLQEILRPYKVHATVGHITFVLAQDSGKGGWSNRISGRVEENHKDAYRMLYLSDKHTLSAEAFAADNHRDDAQLGELLGIPHCCRTFFTRHAASALKMQGDLTPFTLANSAREHPALFWNNILSQYFGYALLSFFPCSLGCKEAADIARRTHHFLSCVDSTFAACFIVYQLRAYIYSEHEGLFMFQESRFSDNVLFYNGVTATVGDGDLAHALNQGNSVSIVNAHYITISRDKVPLLSRSIHEVRLILFTD